MYYVYMQRKGFNLEGCQSADKWLSWHQGVHLGMRRYKRDLEILFCKFWVLFELEGGNNLKGGGGEVGT